ncbi:hypothetical protein KC19_4G073400 [Ceratodon purpureus]|uniref:Uncharacterized protein n=1 Tax=Ceratodon purpureus TaxID=3225 RepID=A0A8T0I801_CERPU|nr:hypothetical protein KC19_4G073400 [Ceratodon purpureus]
MRNLPRSRIEHSSIPQALQLIPTKPKSYPRPKRNISSATSYHLLPDSSQTITVKCLSPEVRRTTPAKNQASQPTKLHSGSITRTPTTIANTLKYDPQHKTPNTPKNQTLNLQKKIPSTKTKVPPRRIHA